MRRKSFDGMACGIAQALERIGDGWTLLILREAMFGTRTFEEFCENLGIARNTLTARLNDLVDHGLLSRRVDEGDNRKKTYRIEEPGRELWIALLALQQWGNKWCYARDKAPSFMADRKTGAPVAPLKVFDRKGAPLDIEDVTMVPGPGATERLKARFREMDRRRAAAEGDAS